MGKGKGAPHTWVHRLNAGKILLEVNSVSSEDINVLLNKAGKKLPIPCTVVHGKTARLKQQR
jgi:ribosomal protein L16/L10AE